MDNEKLYNLTKDPSFAVSVAYEYQFGMGGKPQDLKMAIKWYRIAGDQESLQRAKQIEKDLKNAND